MKAMFANGAKSAGILTVFTIGFTALMAGGYALTRDIVQKNEIAARTQLISQTLPAGSFDNDLLADARELPLSEAKKLGNSEASQLYFARKAGKPVAVVVEATAPDGYAGQIKLIAAVGSDGRVIGVRVVAHKETPGLGDYIDAAKSDWIHQFDGKSLTAPAAELWKVKKDGGAFDARTGATISPRAVVRAVKNVLDYVASNRASLFEAKP